MGGVRGRSRHLVRGSSSGNVLVDFRYPSNTSPLAKAASSGSRETRGLADHDLELLDTQTLDAKTLELTYRPTPHA